MPKRCPTLCKLVIISLGYYLHKSFRCWKKSRFENSMWVADNIGTTNSKASSSAAHFGFSNLVYFQNLKFLRKCYPKLIKGSLHNFSGLLYCVILQLLWFKSQKLFCAWFVYMHTTLSKFRSFIWPYSKRLSTLGLSYHIKHTQFAVAVAVTMRRWVCIGRRGGLIGAWMRRCDPPVKRDIRSAAI